MKLVMKALQYGSKTKASCADVDHIVNFLTCELLGKESSLAKLLQTESRFMALFSIQQDDRT
eukprot:5124181-Pyramimonas_sp.AAC.1